MSRSDQRPTSGVRVILELVAVDADEVRYEAWLYTPDAKHHGLAWVTFEDGEVAFGWSQPYPPAWMADLVRAFLRTEWRARREPNAAPWPARISRWRAGP